MDDLQKARRFFGGIALFYLIVTLVAVAWHSHAGDVKYFISSDESWIREINGRPFTNAVPGTVTTQLVNVIKHPASNFWAAVIPLNQAAKLPRYLTPGEMSIITNAWVDTLPEGWVTNVTEEAP